MAKVVVSAAIVIALTLASERLGPRMGGLIAATPQLSVLALIFLSIEQGRAFAAESAFWTIPGMCATIPVYFAYLVATSRFREPRLASIAFGAVASVIAFAVSVGLLSALHLPRVAVVPFAAVVCFISARLVRRLPDTACITPVRTSAARLVARAAASALVVIAVTAAAEALGPRWSGLILGFPANSLPVMAILHFHYGRDAIRPIVKIWPVGAFGICLFNVAAWLATVRFGVTTAIALGYAVDLAYLAVLTSAHRRLACGIARAGHALRTRRSIERAHRTVEGQRFGPRDERGSGDGGDRFA
jgi:uncharacterized membrane protein (GlpM family)